MSGLDLAAIHTALADQIRSNVAISGEFTVVPHPSTSDRPAIEIHPGSPWVNYFDTSGADGVADVNLVIEVYQSRGNAESEHIERTQLASAGVGFSSSIVDAVMVDRSLNGAVADAVTLNVSVDPQNGTISIPVAIMVNKIGAHT